MKRKFVTGTTFGRAS